MRTIHTNKIFRMDSTRRILGLAFRPGIHTKSIDDDVESCRTGHKTTTVSIAGIFPKVLMIKVKFKIQEFEFIFHFSFFIFSYTQNPIHINQYNFININRIHILNIEIDGGLSSPT